MKDGCTCQSCGTLYKIDIMIPDDLWFKISPKKVEAYKAGGLLCGSCIMQRLEKEINDYDYFFLQKTPS